MRRAGVQRVVAVAVRGDASKRIEAEVDEVVWLHAGQLGRTINWLASRNVAGVVFAGQITPGRLFKGLRPDLRSFRLLRGLAERNAESIFSAIANEFDRAGVPVRSSIEFMADSLAPVGRLGAIVPNRRNERDIEFGLRMARDVSRLDIGQTVVVKRGTVLAVEGFEGTDSAIRRGGELGHGGVTVVKTAKPNQDWRFDVPCVGLNTVESLKHARAAALVVQAGATLVLGKADVRDALDAVRIAFVGAGQDGIEA